MSTSTATATLATISTFTMLIGIILMVGSIRGVILLIKDAMKHKKFAKVIRLISAIVQIVSLLGSIVIVSIILSNPESIGTGLSVVILILGAVNLLSVITNTRGGILLFMESKKHKKFKKWIRIICGALMIISLFSSFLTNM